MRHDVLGNVLEVEALDAAGAPTYVDEGRSRVKYGYDQYGNAWETAVFDEAGRPALHRGGWHRRALNRDARGRIVDERY